MFKRMVILSLITLSLAGCFSDQSDNPQTLAQQWNTPDKQWTEAELRQLSKGQNLYKASCSACHLSNGEGQLSIGAPPLKGNQLLSGDLQQAINTITNGRGSMPAFAGARTPEDLSAILSYVSNAWGNQRGEVVSTEAFN